MGGRRRRAATGSSGPPAPAAGHRRCGNPLLDAVEQRWRARFGPAAIETLRRSLLSVTGQRNGGRPRLALGLQPYPDGWRARGPYLRQTTAVLNDPGAALPHYPMVLHRGGWPDGS
jgi:hypothetical protein